MGRSTVHYADNKTNNALKSLHNKLRPAGTPVQRVEYIIELLLLRIFETKIKQDDKFKPLRELFSTDYKWLNPKTGKEESNENRLFSYLPTVSNDQILSELNDNFFPFYSTILQSARKVFKGNLPQKVQDQLVLIEEVFSNSNFTNNVNSGNLGEVINIVANDIEETRLLKTDLLGDAIESALSETGGTKDVGLFRTPDHVRQFMTALIEPTFYNGENGENSAIYAKYIINQGLDGQFEAYLAKGLNGNTVLAIRPTEGGGDFSKMSESALAFYYELSMIINDHSVTAKIDVFYGNSDVTTGNYKNNAIDIADMMQYNAEGGATRAGKMIHELTEQYAKAKDGILKGDRRNFDKNHKTACRAEGRVIGWIRDPNTYEPYRGVYETKYYRKDGSAFSAIFSLESNGIIQVNQPKPRGGSLQRNRIGGLR